MESGSMIKIGGGAMIRLLGRDGCSRGPCCNDQGRIPTDALLLIAFHPIRPTQRVWRYMDVEPKNRDNYPKMDGENNGKHY